MAHRSEDWQYLDGANCVESVYYGDINFQTQMHYVNIEVGKDAGSPCLWLTVNCILKRKVHYARTQIYTEGLLFSVNGVGDLQIYPNTL